ncbi:hypothetical protein C4J81_16110 [Deltaproteobacteria bacterium Smac51]|nr:hypothetical protein C4J81_16110 [Deltaproteobacteria bacterium Smac51]
MAVSNISFKKILVGLGGVFLVCAAAVLLLAWRSMSFDIVPAPVAEPEKTISLHFDDFSISLPESFSLDHFNASLNWAEARITINERWRPDHESALQHFEESRRGLAERYEVIDISAVMGLPAVMVSDIPETELADKPAMLVALICENVQLNFILMTPSRPDDTSLWEPVLIGRVKDFLQFYHPSPSPEPAPKSASEMRTMYGTVDPGPRDGYVFTIGFAALTRDEQTFYINTITNGERLALRPGFNGKISRFFQNLDATGVISGVGLKDLNLDGVSGHEIIRKHPFLSDGPLVVEFDWQENPDGLYGKSLALSTGGAATVELPALYGQWRLILDSVRF